MSGDPRTDHPNLESPTLEASLDVPMHGKSHPEPRPVSSACSPIIALCAFKANFEPTHVLNTFIESCVKPPLHRLSQSRQAFGKPLSWAPSDLGLKIQNIRLSSGAEGVGTAARWCWRTLAPRHSSCFSCRRIPLAQVSNTDYKATG